MESENNMFSGVESETSKKDVLKELSDEILTPKEKQAEEFITEFLQMIHSDEHSFSADLSMQQKLIEANKMLSECSMILAHKYQPIIADLISQQEQKNMNEKYGIIKCKNLADEDLSKRYLACFVNFINDKDCVSLRTANMDLLGALDIKDYFTLMYFAIITCKRQAGDNTLQLIICGKSSCGKSAIFENPIQEIAHNMTADQGCGRFITGAKSTLLLHDCNLDILVKGRDMDKLKSITRTEPITTKIHSKTNCVPPLFVVVTSNKHIYNHKFKQAEKIGFRFVNLYKSDIQPTKTTHEADIEAVRNRYIECFVRQRPTLPANSLPSSSNFKKNHVIIGLFQHVANLLLKYDRKDFCSEYLFLYPIIGMCKNVGLLKEDTLERMENILFDLLNKFELDEEQKHQCWVSMQSSKKESKIKVSAESDDE